jgi:hypothetical protein
VPKALAQDPLFQILIEAFEGRSHSAVRAKQLRSSWAPRQRFLDLIHRRIPASDIASLRATIDAAVQFYDKIPEISEQDYVFLAALLQFLREFNLINSEAFEASSQEIQARVHAKEGTFENYLAQWHGRTEEQAFDRSLLEAVKLAERMHKNKQEALRRKSESQARREEIERQEHQQEERVLGEELQFRQPVREDLERLVPKERSLVHAIHLGKPEGFPINWQALSTERFRNKLTVDNYRELAKLWQGQEEEEEGSEREEYTTPPGSPMIIE